jgi:DNA-directed RNA polymerase specialized sigma24 family protein
VLWFLLWFVLVVAAAAFLGYLARDLYRKAKALMRDAAAASDRFGEITAAMYQAPAPRDSRSDLR